MAIGDLYSAENVVVGQAAVFFAPKNTALPSFSKWNVADPFDPGYFESIAVATGTATSFTLAVTNEAGTQTTGDQTVSGLTASALQTALAGLSNVGAGNVEVTGTGGNFSVTFLGDAEGSTMTGTPTPTGGGFAVTASLWVPCGATDQGWQFSASKSTQTIGIEEQSTPVGVTLTSQSISLAGSLSEDITKTLALALNATAASVASGAGTPGYDQLTLTDTPIEYAVAAVTTNAHGFGRLIYAPTWTQLNNVQTSFRRAADKRMYAVQFDTVCRTKDIAVYDFTAAGS